MKHFSFQLFSSHRGGNLKSQLEDIECQLFLWMLHSNVSIDELMQSRVYLSDASNQWASVLHSPLYIEALSKGAVSYIEQPLLNGAKVAVQMLFAVGAQLHKSGNPDNMKILLGAETFIFHSVRFEEEEVRHLNAKEQTKLAFRRHMDVLAAEGMNLAQHCHRTWIYVRDIDRHYAGVVEGRNEIFAGCGLTSDTHYIASTGIGGFSDNRAAIVCMDFFSYRGNGTEQIKYLQALDYLNPTHEYGVAFERGTQLILPECSLYFISGTASIDKYGKCLHRGDVLTQAGRLFLNIEKLLQDGGADLQNLQYMMVYLRDIADYQEVDRYLRLRFPAIPYLIVEARVCRPEWLIEVEAIAEK